MDNNAFLNLPQMQRHRQSAKEYFPMLGELKKANNCLVIRVALTTATKTLNPKTKQKLLQILYSLIGYGGNGHTDTSFVS